MILGLAAATPAPAPSSPSSPAEPPVSPLLIGATAANVGILTLVDRQKHPIVWWWFGFFGLCYNGATLATKLVRKR